MKRYIAALLIGIGGLLAACSSDAGTGEEVCGKGEHPCGTKCCKDKK